MSEHAAFEDAFDESLRRHTGLGLADADELMAKLEPCARCGERASRAPSPMCATCQEKGPLTPEEAARWRARQAEDES